MTHYFLDSSALVKRYIVEQGTGWVRAITDPKAANAFIIAQITQAEVVSGIARRQREKLLTPRTAHAIRLLFDRHVKREYAVVEQTPAIIQRAEDLLEKHPLRAYDAVQLASALTSNNQLIASGITPLTFVSGDTRLLSIAGIEGLSVDDPNLHP